MYYHQQMEQQQQQEDSSVFINELVIADSQMGSVNDVINFSISNIAAS